MSSSSIPCQILENAKIVEQQGVNVVLKNTELKVFLQPCCISNHTNILIHGNVQWAHNPFWKWALDGTEGQNLKGPCRLSGCPTGAYVGPT